jgi:alanine racemase
MAQCWVEVDLEKLRANFRALRALVGGDTAIIAVVKADAYGLGAVEVGRALAAEGARYLAVTRVEEAVELRSGGIEAPILLLSPTPHADLPEALAHGLTLCVSSLEDVRAIAREAQEQGKVARCGLKVNTGMNRFGVSPESAAEVAEAITREEPLQIETCWTHFMDAGEAKPVHVDEQYARFTSVIGPVSRATGLAPREFHCANSSALLRFPALRLSCVRTGTLLFGQFPGAQAAQSGKREGLSLLDPFAVKARVLSIQEVPAGRSVGYGAEWTASKPSRIATLGVGFADGLTVVPRTRDESAAVAMRKSLRDGLAAARKLVARGAGEAGRRVFWCDPHPEDGNTSEQPAQIVGRVAMQCCHVDVSHLPRVRVGDAFRVPMRRTAASPRLSRLYSGG